MADFGKWLIFIGVLAVAAGLALVLNVRLSWLGRIPGDLVIKKENFSFYFPLATCLVLSILLSFLLYLFRIFKR